jgi:hypothetical protein
MQITRVWGSVNRKFAANPKPDGLGYGLELWGPNEYRIRLFDHRIITEMKIARTVLLICALLGSFVPPIFFLAVRHFHLEGETAEWLVSLWPRSLGSVALEDRRALANMLITYGELAGANMLIYSAIGWSVVISFRIFRRAGAKETDPGSLDSGNFRSD